jgi:hypothetical protein
MGAFTTLASVILLSTHLVAMNVASAAPLICVWLRYRERHDDAAAGAIGQRLALWSFWCLLAGIALGFVMLGIFWMTPDPGYRQAVARFPAKAYVFAAAELAFSAACLALYAGYWNRFRERPWWHALLALLATTNLLYHFPALMFVLGELSAQPEWVLEPLVTRREFRSLLLRPELIGKVLHFAFASVAVSGVVLMLFARRHIDSEIADQRSSALIRAGAAIAFGASLIQIAIGAWVLLQLPNAARNALIGDDWLGTGLFFLSIVALVGMLRALAGVAGGDTGGAAVGQSAILLVLVVALMTASLVRSRYIQSSSSALFTASVSVPARTFSLQFVSQRTDPAPLRSVAVATDRRGAAKNNTD